MKNFSLMNKIISVVLLAVILFFALIMLRGNEDTWICVQGKWLKHGNPSAPMPMSQCK
jgi:hypothetical protein